MKKVLIVSPRFPPVNAADMHRVRQSLPYFRENGWEPVVLAVDPLKCDALLDPLLEKSVPEDIQVVRSNAFDISKSRRFGLGNLDMRALPFLAREGSKLLKADHFDLVYFSTTAFTIMALGRYWLSRFGTPYILDLQDPWLNDYYAQPNAPSPPGGRVKYALSQVIARVLEPWTMYRTHHIVSVSPAYPPMLMQRYAWLRPEQFTVLPFGAPEKDFEELRRNSIKQSIFDPSDGNQHWVYVGAAGEIMRFALHSFFSALSTARKEDPEYFAQLRLHFVGTDYAMGERARKTVEPIASECGVADIVIETPHRIPYFEALQCLIDADALIVPGSGDPGYTASKLYPYILARKPLLAIFHEQSSVVDVLRTTHAGIVVTFAQDNTHEEIAQRIQSAWFEPQTWRTPHETSWEIFAAYTAQEMTRSQCKVFNRVVEYSVAGR